MTSTIVHKCPRCSAENQNFEIAGIGLVKEGSPTEKHFEDGNPTEAEIAVICMTCGQVSGFRILTTRVHNLTGLQSMIWHSPSIQNDVDVISVSPKYEEPGKIEYLPAAVERSFVQGEDNRIRRNNDASGTMYRKALDLATAEKCKSLNIRLKQDTIFNRIEALSKHQTNPLTPDMVEWAHIIRKDGNLASHDEVELTDKEIVELGNFTKMLLIYLYEMPERVKAFKTSKGQISA